MFKLTPSLVGECAMWLSIVSQLFGTRMTGLLEPYGMTHGQFSILNHIVRHKIEGGLRISDIAAAVEVGQPAVTKAIAKFERMNLVEILEGVSDKRSKRVCPTKEGSVLLNKVFGAVLDS